MDIITNMKIIQMEDWMDKKIYMKNQMDGWMDGQKNT